MILLIDSNLLLSVLYVYVRFVLWNLIHSAIKCSYLILSYKKVE